MRKHIAALVLLLVFCSCSKKEKTSLFEDVAIEAGIDFSNDLTYTEEFNPYTYRNFFNGAGVALGDINNDGLLDIYFTGNQVDNKLFLNQGNWKFKDITSEAGVACSDLWSSGTTFADVNADGFLDLYVCKSGLPGGERRYNELFINNGDNTFTENAQSFNLDIEGLSTHAAFFDYDKDGDLDVYILTNSGKSVGVGFELIEGQRNTPDPTGGGNKFMRNDGGVFKDITLEAGMYSSAIGFGLGITLGDFNNDSWGDIMISNDFFERDYLYINDQNGGFREQAEEYFNSISMGSMGADAADLNNDGNIDIMVTEMLPSTVERRRVKTIFESWDKYQLGVSKGYYHQFARNVLQRNTGTDGFVELGRYSGVAATEWSWGALLFDMNNDGLRDIFISNGIAKDLLDRDYLNYMANPEQVRAIIKEGKNVIGELLEKIPSEPVVNAAFLNQGGFVFENASSAIGLGKPSFSNGSAYGDLDNDGDLDLVVNNINMPAQIFQNNTDTSQFRSIRIALKGTGDNTSGIGAKAVAYHKGVEYHTENYLSRGFQSSVDPILHIGLGNIDQIDSLVVTWNRGLESKLFDVKTNELLKIKETQAQPKSGPQDVRKETTTLVHSPMYSTLFEHKENVHSDFNREPLLTEMYNNLGPAMDIADINNDGIEDLFVGGAKNQSGVILKGGKTDFTQIQASALEQDAGSEDIASVFFDCDNDGDVDLYVCSGGRAFSSSSEQLGDRLYINDGQGNLIKENDRLPIIPYFNSSCVKASDFDNDGDLDLFVGERFHPFYYGRNGGGYLLTNDGNGRFNNATMSIASELQSIGMVSDAAWLDVNNDKLMDLVVVGDWMNVKIFINDGEELKDRSADYLSSKTSGFWNCIEVADIDNDGDDDFILGNQGRNTFHQEGMRMYRGDFDKNGSEEHIICEKRGDKFYPVADKDELTQQLPSLKKRFFYYKDYASATIEDLFDEEQLKAATVFEVDELHSALFLNTESGFVKQILPSEAQYTSIYAIKADDLNDDGYIDLILGGNQYLVKPQYGRYDGLNGLICFGSSDGFSSDNVEFMNVKGQIRDIEIISNSGKELVIFAVNGDKIQIYEKGN